MIALVAVLIALLTFLRLMLMMTPSLAQYRGFILGDSPCYALLAIESPFNIKGLTMTDYSNALGTENITCPSMPFVQGRIFFPTLLALVGNLVGAFSIYLVPVLLATISIGTITYVSARISNVWIGALVGIIVSWSLVVTHWSLTGMADITLLAIFSLSNLLVVLKPRLIFMVLGFATLVIFSTLTKQSWIFWFVFSVGAICVIASNHLGNARHAEKTHENGRTYLLLLLGPTAYFLHVLWSSFAGSQVGPLIVGRIVPVISREPEVTKFLPDEPLIALMSPIIEHTKTTLVLIANIFTLELGISLLIVFTILGVAMHRDSWTIRGLSAIIVGLAISFANGSDTSGRFMIPAIPFLAAAGAIAFKKIYDNRIAGRRL